MTGPNAELAYRALDHIDAHPEQWRQDRWIGKSDCGTVGCFAGWTVLLSGAEPIEFDPFWRDGKFTFTSQVQFGDEELFVSELAERLLHADRYPDGVAEDGRDLFDEANTREDLGRLVEEIFGPRPDGAQ